MNAGRVTIDTNVLVYAVDGKAGERHLRALRLVNAAVDWDSVLVLQVLNEFFAVTTGKGKMDPAEAATSVEEWLRLFPVHAAGPGTLRHAMAAGYGASAPPATRFLLSSQQARLARNGGTSYICRERDRPETREP